MPIQEYMQRIQPPGDDLIKPLLMYFQELLKLYKKYEGTKMGSATVAQVLSNFFNIQNVLSHGLQPDHPEIRDIILCTLYLNFCSRNIGRGPISFLGELQKILPYLCDHWLEANFITEFFATHNWFSIPDPDSLVAQALEHFRQIDDPDLQCGLLFHTLFE